MSTSNWWANKLGAPAVPQQQPVQPQYQAPQQYAPPAQQYAPPRPQAYPPQPQQYVDSSCPGCGSGNYGGATPEARKRCYDCGYPIQQSGSGVGKGIVSGGGQASGPTQAAVQVQSGGWNPTTIIGHI